MSTPKPLLAASLCALLAACNAIESDGLDKSRYDIIEIIKAGGNVTVSAGKFSRYDLTEIAKQAQKSGVELTIVDANNLDRYSLVEIAKAAPGTIRFEN